MKNSYVLFIGRWQPFHGGHKKLIEKAALKKGKNVCIAIRDTAVSEKNPYGAQTRARDIRLALREWSDKVKVIVIPDTNEIVFGRGYKKAYKVREVPLDKKTEAISSAKLRQERKEKKSVH